VLAAPTVTATFPTVIAADRRRDVASTPTASATNSAPSFSDARFQAGMTRPPEATWKHWSTFGSSLQPGGQTPVVNRPAIAAAPIMKITQGPHRHRISPWALTGRARIDRRIATPPAAHATEAIQISTASPGSNVHDRVQKASSTEAMAKASPVTTRHPPVTEPASRPDGAIGSTSHRIRPSLGATRSCTMGASQDVPFVPKRTGFDRHGGRLMRVVAIVGWVVIVASFLIWQGLGLTNAPEWPTMSQLFHDFMGLPFGRYVLFGIWLWLGWHLFARGAGALV